jgi:hypothetical protein
MVGNYRTDRQLTGSHPASGALGYAGRNENLVLVLTLQPYSCYLFGIRWDIKGCVRRDVDVLAECKGVSSGKDSLTR